MILSFTVQGVPVPKQSFRVAKNGHHYQNRHLLDWQAACGWAARIAQLEGTYAPLSGDISVKLTFYMANNRRADCDNLAKGVMDGLNKIIFYDDSQVVHLEIDKRIDRENPRCEVEIRERNVL